MRKRLDIVLAERGIIKSRTKAQSFIMQGRVLVNGVKQFKAGYGVKDDDEISVTEDPCPFVSRGGLKLEAALKHFNISVENKICLDVGASTGGFSDCFIKKGAKLVYAVDVGKGQLDYSLSKNPKLMFIPQTNARYLTSDIFKTPPEIAAIDVSFISLKMVLLPVLECLTQPADLIALIKPQFELTSKDIPRGIVKSDECRQKAISGLQDFFKNEITPKFNAKDLGIIESPIKGAKGNIEYLWHITKGSIAK